MRLLKKIKNEKGVSLLELLVAVTLFSVVIISSTQIFKMVVDGQRNAIGAQNVQENIRYAMERMSKEIRMAQIAYRGTQPADRDCKQLFTSPDTATNKVYNLKSANAVDDTLYFKNKDNVCVAYFLENNRLKVKIIKAAGGILIEDFIMPSNTITSNLKFYVADNLIGAYHSVQPYVTMTMDVKAVGLAMHEQKMKIQFTVSSRYYE